MTDSTPRTSREPRIKAEVRLFLTAVMFYTRIPCPKWVGYSDDQLNRSTRYFPVIGWIVGIVVAATIYVTNLILPTVVAVLLGLAAGVLLTGAFHEDGFADVCDGFGGSTSRERTLEIMKDSRVGTFAVVGLVLLFGIKIASLTTLIGETQWLWLVGLLFAHVASRWCVVTIIFTNQYARADLTSKVKPIGKSISTGGMIAASVWLLPFAALAWWAPWWLLALPIAFLVRLILARWFRKRLGGYTGDCLGAAEQIIGTVIILMILAVQGILA